MATKKPTARMELMYGRYVDPRHEKRAFRKMGMSDLIYLAHCMGEAAAMRSIPRHQINPFPPGERHDAFDRGFLQADPMGEWMGRNQ